MLDVLDGAGPLHLAERRVNRDKLLARNDAREQDRHRLAVLAAAVIDGDESSHANHLPAPWGHGSIGDAAEHEAVPRR